MFLACSIIGTAFLLAFFAMLLKNQPANIAFICFISFLLIVGFAIVLYLDIRRESKTMKVLVFIQNGLPVDIVSDDIEEINIMNFKQKIDRKRLSNRELTAHIIHHYEQQKALDVIKPDTELQIKFKEAVQIVATGTQEDVEAVNS